MRFHIARLVIEFEVFRFLRGLVITAPAGIIRSGRRAERTHREVLAHEIRKSSLKFLSVRWPTEWLNHDLKGQGQFHSSTGVKSIVGISTPNSKPQTK